MHLANGDSVDVFDGRAGWSVLQGRRLREIAQDELDEERTDADLRFPLHIRQMFADLRVEYPEKVDDGEAFVISYANVGKAPVKLYFDQHSALLLRVMRCTESPLGLVPTQIDYGDYRDIDGVKTAFRWTLARPESRTTIQWERIQQNVNR